MTPPRYLRAVLRRAGERDAPPVDTDFANQLESRLRVLASGPVPQGRLARGHGRRPWTAAGAIAIAAAAVAAVLISQSGDHTNQVTTLPDIATTVAPATEVTSTTSPITTTTTATTVAPPVSTTVAPSPVTVGATTGTTSRPRATTTTSTTTKPATTTTTEKPTVTVLPTTSTTTKPTTTTTTAPGQQNLALACQSTGTVTSPAITCRWAQSTSDSFSNYRLIRKMDGQETVLIAEDPNRSTVQYVDTSPRLGATITYGVVARNKNGTILGQGQATVTCC